MWHSVLLLLLVTVCRASFVGWIIGRDNSPFDILNSENHFEDLMAKSSGKVEPAKDAVQPIEENAVAAIPFELSVAEEKFLADAQKYTDLILSELDVCQHKVYFLYL
jgi:hypothetical protein